MNDQPVIVATGLASAVGEKTTRVCSSVRAKIRRLEAINWVDRGGEAIVMGRIPDGVLEELPLNFRDKKHISSLLERLIRIANFALEDISGFRDKIKMPLFLALPKDIGAERPMFPFEELTRQFSRISGIPLMFDHSRIILNGRAGGLTAVYEAIQALQEGRYEAVLAGGVDSYKNEVLLRHLDQEGRLLSELNPHGFIPGEGCGLMVLTLRETARRRNWEVLSTITACAVAEEKGHLESELPFTGEGLSDTFRYLLRQNRDRNDSIKIIYSSMNGEEHWARELGVAVIRHKKYLDSEYRTITPADCHGDTGAAAGPLLLGMAMMGMRKGYAPGPALVYSSSDQAGRAAVIVESVEGV